MPDNFEVDREDCILCASCSSLAPEVFQLDSVAARVARQPQTKRERDACTAAMINCPTAAIRLTQELQ